MVNIALLSGTKTKFYDPEVVIKFDYDPVALQFIRSLPGKKFNKRTKTWHIPSQSLEAVLDYFPDAVVNKNIKTKYPKRSFSSIDFPTTITMGWGSEAYTINTVYKLNTGEPIKVRATPYQYQREGIKFLATQKNVILADDMGLGKTLQSLSATVLIKAKKVLIVCPASAKYNWAEEIEKFIPNAGYVVVDGSKSERQRILRSKAKIMFYIINYDALLTLEEEVSELNPDVIILDEAHRIKNRRAKRTKAIKKLNAPYKFLLTGTPLMNRIEELWSLLKFIQPNKWPGYDAFVKQYCVKGGYQNRENVGVKNLDVLKSRMKPIMLRRRKDEVLKDLPEKIYQDCYIDLDPKTMAIYRQAENEARAYVSQNKSIAINGIFAKLTRLKQISVAPEILGATHQSAKIVECEKVVEELTSEGKKVIIYSQFKDVTNYLEKLFRNKGINLVHVNGDVSTQDRQKMVNEFQNNKDCMIFLGTTQACKEALTLTAASHVIFMDKLWNPQDNRQAADRAHRIGQKNTVNVISFIARNTIEERIEKILKEKQDLFDEVIEKDNGVVVERKTLNSKTLISEILG